MKKKTIILFAILLVILVGIACYMQYRYTHQSIKSFTATGCTAEGIIVKDSVSYLEVQFDDEKHPAKKIAVKDEEILKRFRSQIFRRLSVSTLHQIFLKRFLKKIILFLISITLILYSCLRKLTSMMNFLKLQMCPFQTNIAL